MKKLLCLFAAAVLAVTLCLTVFAAEKFDGGVSLAKIDENGERVYTVVYGGARNGDTYTLCVIGGFHSSVTEFKQDDVVYYNTAVGGENGCIFENVRLMVEGSFTAYVIDSRGKVTIAGTYREDYVPEVPPDLPANGGGASSNIVLGIVIGVVALACAAGIFLGIKKYLF